MKLLCINIYLKDISKFLYIRESTRESRVRIRVGEDNGFSYEVNGYTPSPYRISTSGEYYNNADTSAGGVRLFLSVEDDISFTDISADRDVLYVYLETRRGYAGHPNYSQFYFDITCPYPAEPRDLYVIQINSTSVLVVGPSRSTAGQRRALKSGSFLVKEWINN